MFPLKYQDIAKKAIKKYPITPTDIVFLTEETNVFYTIMAEEGTFVLKIYHEDANDINDNLTEHFLLKRLHETTDLKMPQVVENKRKETVTKIPFPNPRGYKRTALYTYLEAETIAGLETAEYFETVGAQVAKMHQATKGLLLPEHVNPRRFDQIFYLEHGHAVYHKHKYRKYLTEEMIQILDELVPYINLKLAAYYDQAPPRLIHGNLNPWNIKRQGNELCFFDFEEAKLAYPLHDIALFLYYYKHHETLEYPILRDHFLKGYRSVSPEPHYLDEKDLSLVMMAKRIHLLNYVLLHKKDPSDYIAMSFPNIKEYYLSYK